MKIIHSSVPLLTLLLMVSCTNSKSDQSPPLGINQNEVVQADGSNIQGHYAAEIWPVNYNLHFKQIGTVGVRRADDEFSISVKLDYGPKGKEVKQALFTGRRCPNLNDDINKDAYIDILEAKLAIGKITIPFDGSLDSQAEGQGIYPIVDSRGKMFYTQSTSFSEMYSDLKGVDQDPSDEIIKLKDEEGMTLPGRIVLFQGVPESVELPQTVTTIGGESAHDSLPVGCAVLWKVNEMPAELLPETNLE